jgi:hypothetical protein
MAQGLDMLMASGTGALGGASTGAKIGGMLGSVVPGVGNVVGAGVGAGVGALVGGGSAAMKQKKATEAQKIPLVDPMERQRLAELELQRKNLLAGTDAITQNAISEAKNLGSATNNAIIKNTGGDVSSTMDALLRAQKGTQQGVNQAVMEGRQRLPYFDSAAGNLNSRIAQRKLELGLLKRSQATAENAQARTDNNVNAQALLATEGGIMTPEQIAEMLKKRQMQQASGGLTQMITPNEVNVDGMTNVMGDWSSPMVTNNGMPTLDNINYIQ